MMGELEQLECEITVLLDLLRRSHWYLGPDKQSSAPTVGETQVFLDEIRDVLWQHRKEK